MNSPYLKAVAGIAVLATSVLSVACIDDNYDLSDIDTTTELKVNDLTVPVNFKDIYLDNIIDLDDSNPDAVIKIIDVNGTKYYYFQKDGNFDAYPKTIAPVEAPAPDHIESSTIHIYATSTAAPQAAGDGDDCTEYAVTPYHTDFDYPVGSDGNPKVDPSIKAISAVRMKDTAPMYITLDFSSDAIAAKASRVELHDLVITVPEGMTAHYGATASSEGKITIPYLESTTGRISVRLKVSALDFVTDSEPKGKEVTDGKFDFTERVGVESGRFLVFPDAGFTSADMPSEIDFNTDYDMTGFTVDMFSGSFDYAIDFDEIDPFELTDLPDFLTGPQTNVILAKPMLTLEVNSPVARYGLECITGLTLTAERNNGGASRSEVLDAFEVTDASDYQLHVLAPDRSVIDAESFPAGTPVFFTPFPGLGNILSGEGLPEIVRVDFTSPAEPSPRVIGDATDFPLGVDLEQVHGEYTFAAPLALADGSSIIYTKTQDGWNDEDVDAIAISKLKITAKLTSDIPAGAKVYIRPVDTAGNRIPLTNAETAYATMPAMASNHEVSLELLGDIRHLDGIYIEAIADDFDGTTLSPDFTIKVSDLRATVTGTYTKEF